MTSRHGSASISDAEAAVLSNMPNLERLDLSITSVTDGIVQTLCQLNRLKQLTITETGISEDGMNRIREALPDCALRSE